MYLIEPVFADEPELQILITGCNVAVGLFDVCVDFKTPLIDNSNCDDLFSNLKAVQSVSTGISVSTCVPLVSSDLYVLYVSPDEFLYVE